MAARIRRMLPRELLMLNDVKGTNLCIPKGSPQRAGLTNIQLCSFKAELLR